MIITFIKKISVENGHSAEFFFNRIYMASGIRFHVSVVGKDEQLYHFTMAEKNGKWKIENAPQPPQWILNIETELDLVICQSMLS